MRSKTSFCCLYISLAAIITGCTLEPPKEYGEGCEKIQFIWTNSSQTVMPENADSYKFNFNNHVCPTEAPFCMTLIESRVGDVFFEDQHFCSDRRESCPQNTHPYDGKCERDTPQHCGSHDVNCLDRTQGVADADCIDSATGKICKPISCMQTFALLGNACKSGNQCCGEYCNDCSRLSSQPYCYTLEDMVTMECGDQCPYNAELLCNGVCIDSSTSMAFCGSSNCEIHYCPDEPGWRNGSCIAGECQASACATGYHLVKGNPNHCEPDTPQSCGNKLRNCNEIAKATSVECAAGRCRALECETGFYAYDDSCIEIQVVQCGNIQCRPNQKCNPDTLTCECEPGYTDCYGDCFDLTSNAFHCGGCNTICQRQIPNGQNRCENSACTFVCDTGYLFNETTQTCEQQVVSCQTGYHANGGECEPDSLEHCGKHGNACAVENAQNTCDNGHCAFECDTGYHKDGNRCEPDSAGVCTNGTTRCDENNTPQVCENGEWAYCSPHICDVNMCFECAPNDDMRCINSGTAGKVQICRDNKWLDGSCPNNVSCNSDGSACGDCINGSKQCSNRTPQTCTAGEWIDNTECDADKICDNGSCASCGSNQHVYQNTCETNNTTHCGSHDNRCKSVAHATAICTNGSCDFECDGDYTKQGDSCIPASSLCTTPNATRCINTGTQGKMQKCTSDEWQDQKNCDYGYSCNSSGTVCGDCTNNDTQCDYRTPQLCVKGEWVDSGICDDEQVCLNGECDWCDADEHVWDNECEANDIYNCGEHNHRCTRPTHGSVSCLDGTCTIQCDTGYKVDGNTCIADDTYCSDDTKRCNGRIPQICQSNAWSGSTECDSDKYCDAGSCKSCDENYHLKRTGDGCEPDTEYDCGPNHVECPVPNHGSATCSSGSCGINCDPGYKPQGNNCVTDDTYCSNGTKRCNGRIPQICQSNAWSGSTECDSTKYCDEGECKSCDASSHLNREGDGCEPNSVDDCGPEHKVCNVENAENLCLNGDCTPLCYEGYCWNGLTCARTDLTSDPDNCGRCGHVCSLDDFPNATALTCASGNCAASSCETNHPDEYQFILNNGMCEPIIYPCDGTGPDGTVEYLCFKPGKQCQDPSCHSTNNDFVDCGDYYCIGNALCDSPEQFFRDGKGCFRGP